MHLMYYKLSIKIKIMQIEIPDKLYERIVKLAKEVKTQNNRHTSEPYFFQIQTDQKLTSADGYGDKIIWVNSDGEEIEDDEDTILKYLEENEIELRENECPEEWLEDNDFKRISIQIIQKYDNCFFSKKTIEKHIELNDYHYNNPHSYVSSGWRNPDLNLIFELFNFFANEKMF